MTKRKQQQDESDSDGSESEPSLVNIDFDFFDPNPAVDFLALKRLLTQLFGADAQELPVHELAELILDQSGAGSTVKCDGEESDPYAFLTVLNLHVHKDRPAVQGLIAYILDKSSADPILHSKLQTLLGPASNEHVGYIFSERLINMPVQIMPHMYRLFAEEVQQAVDENKPFDFKYFLLISRVYHLTAEEAADLHRPAAPSPKRQKQQQQVASAADQGAGVFPYHPEDDDIRKFATHTIEYAFANAQPREEDSFGLDVRGRMMLVPARRLRNVVAALAEAYPAPS